MKFRSIKLLMYTIVADISLATCVLIQNIENKSIFGFTLFGQHLGSVRHQNRVRPTPLIYCLQLFISGPFA